MRLKGISEKLLDRKRVIIYDQDHSDWLKLQCKVCRLIWGVGFDNDTLRPVKGYWRCPNRCNSK